MQGVLFGFSLLLGHVMMTNRFYDESYSILESISETVDTCEKPQIWSHLVVWFALLAPNTDFVWGKECVAALSNSSFFILNEFGLNPLTTKLSWETMMPFTNIINPYVLDINE